MIEGKKVLAVIPARGGSKGIKDKNIKEIAGKPLIAWTIEEAARSKNIDRLILSSDEESIIQVAKEYCCDVPFVRPAALAQDDTPGVEPILHAIKELPGYDFVVVLQPTSPLRVCSDIDEAIELCVRMVAPACVSVTPPGKNPFWTYYLDEDNHLTPLLGGDLVSHRQNLPDVMALNGAVYVAECEWLTRTRSFMAPETIGYRMPPERSFDIDDVLDHEICDFLLRNRRSL